MSTWRRHTVGRRAVNIKDAPNGEWQLERVQHTWSRIAKKGKLARAKVGGTSVTETLIAGGNVWPCSYCVRLSGSFIKLNYTLSGDLSIVLLVVYPSCWKLDFKSCMWMSRVVYSWFPNIGTSEPSLKIGEWTSFSISKQWNLVSIKKMKKSHQFIKGAEEI